MSCPPWVSASTQFGRERVTGSRQGARLRLFHTWSWRLMLAAGPCAAVGQPVSLEVGAGTRPAATSPAATESSPYGRRVVAVFYQPATLEPAELSLKAGQTLTRENLSAALNEVAVHLGRHSESIAAAGGGSALVFTYVDAGFNLHPRGPAENDFVAVTLRPFHLRLPLDETGARVLPIPRDFSVGLLAGRIPSPLLPPLLTLSHDRVLGTSIAGRWQANLDPFGRREAMGPQFRLRAGGMKSIDSALYAGDADVHIVRRRSSGLLRQISGGAEFSTSFEPRGASRYDSRTWGGTVGTSLSFDANTRLIIDTRYLDVRHRFLGSATPPQWATTREQGNRLVFETIPRDWLGFLRAAVWADNLNPRQGATAHRLVARAGYAKEFSVSVNQSIGVELVAGAGQTWGNIEAPRRFFAGGGQGEFLYDGAASRALTVAPDGPILRSLGRAQGGLRTASSITRGGTQFWHLNLNLALPIPAWSRPLIPNETTDLPGPDGSPQTLKQILGTQIDRTGPNLLQSTLQVSDKLPAEEAKRRATQIFDEIRPAAHFVIDQANVFAVKPLVLLDVAELHAAPGRASWVAAGVGVQLMVVTAKFDAGYMRTLSGPTFGSRGNVFARLGFERLF